ncbi:MAG: hypothetical protein MRY83_12030, partial [Flavobacteriales bacterium]|nr:hypothetical protein [Flavobacteriales bacterium]
MQEHLDYLTKQVNEDPELALFTLIETLDKNLNIQEAEHCLGLLDKLFELTVDREFAIEITKLKIEYTRKFIEWHFQNDESIWRSFLKRFPDDKEAWRQFLDICEDAAYLSFFPSD